MKTGILTLGTVVALCFTSAVAQDVDPIAVARESGVCGDADVVSAIFTDSGTIQATCDDDTEAFLPVAGPLAALLGIGLLAAGGGGTNGTGSTSGTN